MYVHMMLRRQHSMTCRIRHKIVRQFVACLVIPSVLYRRLGDTGFDHLTTLGFVEIPAVILTFAAVSRDRPHISPLLSVLQFGHGPEMEKKHFAGSQPVSKYIKYIQIPNTKVLQKIPGISTRHPRSGAIG